MKGDMAEAETNERCIELKKRNQMEVIKKKCVGRMRR